MDAKIIRQNENSCMKTVIHTVKKNQSPKFTNWLQREKRYIYKAKSDMIEFHISAKKSNLTPPIRENWPYVSSNEFTKDNLTSPMQHFYQENFKLNLAVKKQSDKLKLFDNLPNDWLGIFKNVNDMENKN